VGYSRGALYQLLSNRIYIGKIVHRDQVYAGQHEAIIDKKLWDQVTAQLKRNDRAHRTPNPRAQSSLLTGLLKDTNGVRFTPTHCVKEGKRYRYYTSQAAIRKQCDRPQICRYPARKLETMVTSQIHRLLGTLDQYLKKGEETPEKDRLLQRSKKLAGQWPKMALSKQEELVRALVTVVIVGQSSLWVEVEQGKLAAVLLGQNHTELTDTTTIRLSADIRIVRRGAELEIHTPEELGTRTPEPALIKMVARAYSWYQQFISGAITSIEELSEKTGLKRRYLRQSLQCATLCPAIVNAILAGGRTRQINRRKLLEAIPLDWQEQQQRFL
jgi:site-specific DNA recombinase